MLVAILNPRVEDMLYLFGNFLVILQVEVGYALFSLHTHLCISWVGPCTRIYET